MNMNEFYKRLLKEDNWGVNYQEQDELQEEIQSPKDEPSFYQEAEEQN